MTASSSTEMPSNPRRYGREQQMLPQRLKDTTNTDRYPLVSADSRRWSRRERSEVPAPSYAPNCVHLRAIPFRSSSCLCVFVVFLAVLGCNRNTGPARYDLTGTITYAGKPVSAGYILFAPDKSKGNDGPGADAEIKDGVYRTRPGKGTIGGPHTATVSGFDGKPPQQDPVVNPMGTPLFTNVPIAVDLPRQTATHDLVIPVQKGK